MLPIVAERGSSMIMRHRPHKRYRLAVLLPRDGFGTQNLNRRHHASILVFEDVTMFFAQSGPVATIGTSPAGTPLSNFASANRNLR
jgi:hypothetical protein